MRFDGNGSLRNLKFYFEIEIFSQYKVSVLLLFYCYGLTSPPPLRGKYLLGMVIFQDGYLSKNSSEPLKRMVESNISYILTLR